MRRLLFLMPILLCAAVSAHAQSLDAFKQRLAEPTPGATLFNRAQVTVTEHDDALDQVYDELETLDQDLDDVVSDIYGDDEDDDDENEDEEDHGALYEVTCPNCGEISTLDEETLMDPEGDLVCPHCGATFDIELEGTEDDSAEETDKQDR